MKQSTTYRFEFILKNGTRGVQFRTYRLGLDHAHRVFWNWLYKRSPIRELYTTISDLQVTPS